MHRELLVHLNIGSQKLVSEIRQKIKICTYRYKLTFLQLSVLIYIDCITSLTTVLFYFKEHISALSQATQNTWAIADRNTKHDEC